MAFVNDFMSRKRPGERKKPRRRFRRARFDPAAPEPDPNRIEAVTYDLRRRQIRIWRPGAARPEIVAFDERLWEAGADVRGNRICVELTYAPVDPDEPPLPPPPSPRQDDDPATLDDPIQTTLPIHVEVKP